MASYGVFIGIDRYGSTAINWLSCARRDAVALEALFGDTLGGTTVLVTDEEATRARIAAEFEGVLVGIVDVDESPELAARFGVRGMPTLLAFNDGRETGRRQGLTNEQGVRALIARGARATAGTVSRASIE